MVNSKSSYNMVVVPHRPGLRWLLRLALIASVLVAGFGSYHYGYRSGIQLRGSVVDERNELLTRLESITAEKLELEQSIELLKRNRELDQAAVEGVRLSEREMQQRIFECQEEVAFYKGIMTSKKKGLNIDGLVLEQTSSPRRYRYNLVIQQFAINHTILTGFVQMSVIGVDGPDQRRTELSLSQISDEVKNQDIKLRFRYFQNIEGELVLPEGFEPEGIRVVAQKQGASKPPKEEYFDWTKLLKKNYVPTGEVD